MAGINNRVKSTNDLELKDRLVAINRVTKVTNGGRTFSFSAFVVVGNVDGIVGWVGQAIKVVYYHGGNKNRIPMVFIGQAVREEDIDEERVLVGCKSLRQPFGIEKFIADRQREELHRKNNGE